MRARGWAAYWVPVAAVVVAGSLSLASGVSGAVLTADVEVPRTDPDVEVVVSSIDEDAASSVVAGASVIGAGSPVTGSVVRPETMRAGHSTVDVASVYVVAG